MAGNTNGIIDGGTVNIRQLAVALGGTPWPRDGKFYGFHCPCHNGRRAAASLYRGSDGRLHAHCFGGCDGRQVLVAVAEQLGIPAHELTDTRVVTSPNEHNQSGEDQVRDARKVVMKQEQGANILQQTSPHEPGDLVDRWLRNTRGLSNLDEIPATLRLHPGLKHINANVVLPAMVAPVVDSEGNLIGIHRTWLSPETIDKAPVEPQRARWARSRVARCG